ncbi:MAG TPA: iron-sulfur protein, partial [Acidimicrobiaceae bacterium]|nr:iron-sulfur protein [Acidimicrobiaceae bacterium]
MADKRLRPHHAVIGLGVLVALFTALSGVASVVNGFHDDSPITREVFANVPGSLKLAFYTVIPVLIVYGAVLFAARTRNWQRGAPDDRSTKPSNAKRRFTDFRSGVYMQTLLREPAAGVMHSLIY